MGDLGQRPLNSFNFFTNHSDRLMVRRIRHEFDRFYRVTNLVIAIPNELDSLRGLPSMLVKPFSQFRSHPGEHKAEQHLNRKTIGCSIEIEERKSIHRFSKT